MNRHRLCKAALPFFQFYQRDFHANEALRVKYGNGNGPTSASCSRGFEELKDYSLLEEFQGK